MHSAVAKGSERRLVEQDRPAAKGVVAILDAGQGGLIEETAFE